MRYKLFVKLSDTWEQLDLAEAPACTFQINEFSELEDRNASFSQTISLPRSAHNSRVLGLVDVFEVNAEMPYKLTDVILECDGVDLFPKGSKMYVDEITSTSIETQIVSGVYDIFEELNIPLQSYGGDIDLCAATFEQYPDSRFRFFLTPHNTSAVMGRTTIDVRNVVAAVYLRTYILEMLATHGWRTSIYEPVFDAEYSTTRQYVLGAPRGVERDAESLAGLMFYYKLSSDFSESYMTIDSQNNTYNLMKSGLSENKIYIQLTATESSLIETHVSTPGLDSEFWLQISATLKHAGSTTQLESEGDSTLGHTLYRCNVEKGDIIRVEVSGFFLEIEGVMGVGFNRTLPPDEDGVMPIVGCGMVSYTAGMGFETQTDAMKMYAQLNGFCVDIDHHNKEVKFRSMHLLYDRIADGKSLDWSDKLSRDELGWSYRLENYAQKNIITLKENDEDKSQASWNFQIDDKTLDSETELFEIGIETGRNIERDFGNVAISDMFDLDDNGNIEKYKDKIPVKLVTPIYEEGGYHYTRTLTQGSGSTDYEFDSTWASAPNLAGMDECYAPIVKMLNKARVVTAFFNLSAIDIVDFDFLMPVYIDYFGAYFYVSKINNFIAGQLTEVELIKL